MSGWPMATRRQFAGGAAAALLVGVQGTGKAEAVEDLYGLVGELKAVPGKRAELVGYLLEGSGAMPGNLAYIVAEDLSDPDAIWITEVWRSKADHANSLTLPAVRETIARARPLIAGAGTRAETRPVGFEG
jgi:quinol monooxygenase YgiN